MSDARDPRLVDAVNRALEDLDLEVTRSAPFDHLTDDQAAAFIAGKIREVLSERARLASEFDAWVELARREDLSARVMSGELDDVDLYVRRP
jgi:hypothetical protein